MSFSPETLIMSMKNLKGWPGDGVIALLHTESEANAACKLGVPVVNLSGALSKSSLPRVIVDYRMIGQLAAEHLLERGFERFAFYGLKDLWYSNQRKVGFVERLAAEGIKCSVLEVPSGFGTPRPWRHWIEPLENWLPTLKPPVGVLATHDSRAALMADVCFRLGIRVPNDVAIIGVDNEPFTCELARVPLTSVSRNDHRAGYEAAQLLNGLMDGQAPPEDNIVIPPDGIVTRRSTDVIAITDRQILTLIRYIDEHIAEPFGVERLDKLVSFSRRSLENRFKKSLRCTPHEYIARARVRQAEEFLNAERRQTLGQIAEACGFGDTRRFRIVFQQLTGNSPAEYRRRRLTEL